MAKPGKPPLQITQEMIQKAESLAASGLTKQEIAQCLGMHYDTLNEKTKINPDFAEAIIRGKSKGIAMMANNLVKLAKAGNAAANIFWLKCQAKWREKDDETYIDEKISEEIKKIRKELKSKNKKQY
jgi:hypothetical protein